MKSNTARKAVVAACMESPFYFTLSLQQRLELMKQLEQQPAFSTLRQNFLGWIKTGILALQDKSANYASQAEQPK